MGDASDLTVFWLVVALRLLVPLFVFRFPLPSILASLVIDGVDQTVFQQFTSLDLSSYQSYDKSLDIYYLALAYIATMRNWTNIDAFGIARFLFYYRLAGVTVFELAGGDNRALLLLFANTFEYFFIFYEGVRTRWDPRRLSRSFWLWSAAAIWVCIKLPQEWWIHVAQLDFTEAVSDYPAFGLAVVVGLLALAGIVWFVVRPRLDPPDHATTLQATADLPAGLGRGEVRRSYRVARGGLFDRHLLEKVVLVSLVTVIFGQILPDVDASAVQLGLAMSVLVVLNSAVGLVTARAGRGFDSATLSFLSLAVINVVLVTVIRSLRPSDPYIDAGDTLFFILLLSLIVSLYERYVPVHSVRRTEWAATESARVTAAGEPRDD